MPSTTIPPWAGLPRLAAICLVFASLAMLSPPLAVQAQEPAAPAAADQPPQSLDPRIAITLFAEHPQLVTPTGISVDSRGRVWVLECNTHFPPSGYSRHPSDRLWIMADTDGDGRADQTQVFTDQLHHAMSVVVVDATRVIVATRKQVLLLMDENQDGTEDGRKTLATLETKGDYPHNGLAGLALDPLGRLVFGLGENLGEPYRLIGSDGAEQTGGGEGGNVYRCELDGTGLARVATGFWNPHASCFDAFGRLYTVDNDPDSRPPCRLMHIIQDGDYGYRFRNGRKGLHPYTAWNGELPGTLPMLSGTGEAPSGILAYEAGQLPEEFKGTLLGTSWGDHRLERFVLEPAGSSIKSRPRPFVTGGENFRPVGIALAPDGSLYVSDWVLKDYEVHGQGRVWRVHAVDVDGTATADGNQNPPATGLLSKHIAERRTAAEETDDRFLAQTLQSANLEPRTRVEALYAMLRRNRGAKPAQVAARLKRVADLLTASWEKGDVVAAAALEYEPALLALWPAKSWQQAAQAEDPTFARIWIQSQARLPAGQVSQEQFADLQSWLTHADPFVVSAGLQVGRAWPVDTQLQTLLADPAFAESPAVRLGIALLVQARGGENAAQLLPQLLDDPQADLRRFAVQWAAESGRKDLLPAMDSTLTKPSVSRELMRAVLAAHVVLETSDVAALDQTPSAQWLIKYIADESHPLATRALVLSMLPADAPPVELPLLQSFLHAESPAATQAALDYLALHPRSDAAKDLAGIVSDPNQSDDTVVEAIWLLCNLDNHDEFVQIYPPLMRLAQKQDPATAVQLTRAVRSGARRSEALRNVLQSIMKTAEVEGPLSPEVQEGIDQMVAGFKENGLPVPESLSSRLSKPPADLAAWEQALIDTPGNAAAGRRVFFGGGRVTCAKCHSVNGRGGAIGPDLSESGRMPPARLVMSLVAPSREIAPQFTTWSVETSAGQVLQGVVLTETSEALELAGANGDRHKVLPEEVVTRSALKQSLMPDNVHEQLTVGELRDLVAYLRSLPADLPTAP